MTVTDQEFQEKFSKWLKVLRKRLGVSQSGLGEIIDTSLEAISRWERGLRLPAAQNVLQLMSLATEGERQALIDKAMDPVDDRIWNITNYTRSVAECSECGRVLRIRDFAATGVPAPPKEQRPTDPVRVLTCPNGH